MLTVDEERYEEADQTVLQSRIKEKLPGTPFTLLLAQKAKSDVEKTEQMWHTEHGNPASVAVREVYCLS